MLLKHSTLPQDIYILIILILHKHIPLNKEIRRILQILKPLFGLRLVHYKWSSFTKIYNKRNDFNFEIVNFPFLDGDFHRFPFYGVYISQFIRFARVCSHVDDFNNRNKFLYCYFCVIYVLCFSCFCVCLLLPCGLLLGKGWPLGSCLWCLIVFLSLFHVVSWVQCGTWLYRFLIFVAFLTSKLLNQGHRYHKICKSFSKFYYRHSELIVKYNICLKTLSATTHITTCILWWVIL